MSTRRVECPCCVHRPSGVLSCLPPDLQREIGASRVTHAYQRGQCLFHEGTPARDIFCLSEGVVKIYRAGDDGRQHLLRVVHQILPKRVQ